MNRESLDVIREFLAGEALKLGAVKFRPDDPFTWVSGYRMPIYNDNRRFLADPAARSAIADAFSLFVKEDGWNPDNIAGTATAGIPHAEILADRLGKPMSYVRSTGKDHGLGRKIEGLGDDGSYGGAGVLLIEDLVSTGKSSVAAVKSISEAGGRCPRCYAIFTYGFPEALDLFATVKPVCTLRTILDYDYVLERAKKAEYITGSQFDILAGWRKDPFGWGEKHGFPKEERQGQ